MINTPRIPVPVDPELLDIALIEIQQKLAAGLPWLDYAFGKAEKRIEYREKQILHFPAVYTGGKEYLKVFPDGHIGNFTFFDVDDGHLLSDTGNRIRETNIKIGLILWFDYRKVYPDDWKERTIENVKSDVYGFFNSTSFVNSKIRMHKYWETASKIYRNYNSKEIKNQFLMRPYGGFRIDFDMKYLHNIKCT